MGLRMMLGGEKHHQEEKYMEGYHVGYEHGMEEARRRTRGTWETERDADEEMRRGRRTRSEYDMDEEARRGRRTRGTYDDYAMEEEMRRRRSRGFLPMDHEYEGHYPPAPRQCAPFDHYPEEGAARPIGFRHEATSKGASGGHEEGLMGMAQSLKKIDPRLVGVLESAVGVLDNPPSTWAQYMHRKDFAGIAKMEGKELMTALEAHKPVSDIRKELTHTIAALFQMVSA